MARPKNPKRDESLQIWLNSKGTKKLKDIAAELDVSDTQIRKWKNQDHWDDQLKGNVTKSKGNVTKQKRGAPQGNKNAIGNEGGPPKRNKNAVTHGFFSKFLPKETLEIIESMNGRSPADLIWDQIKIQYAAIIRAQQIMFVNNLDRNDPDYDFDAFDKQAAFLTAQSRAMGELRSLIKQFNEMAHEDDERRLRIESMKVAIEKTKAEINKLSGIDDEDTVNGLDQLADAIQKSASLFKGDE